MNESHELDNQALKQQLQQQYKSKEVKELNFPTEIIDLPSKGLLYSENHPLRDGRVEMKYMTAKEEDILSSQSLIKKGIVLDRLFKSLIVGNGEGVQFEYDDLVVGDKDAIMVAARVLGHGKDYEVTITIDGVQEPQPIVVDLTKLKDKEFDEELFTKYGNDIPFVLPISKKNITFKILTGADEKKIQAEVARIKNKVKGDDVDHTNSTKLKYIITSIEDNDSQAEINKFVDNFLLSRDSFELKEYIKQIQPGVDLRVNIEIPEEGISDMYDIPIDVSFFWPGV
jgi:6-pyruvoyl-tetrahydropterin synthase